MKKSFLKVVSFAAFIFFLILPQVARSDQIYKFVSLQDMNNAAENVVLATCMSKNIKEYLDPDGASTVETEYLFRIDAVYKTNSSNPLKQGDNHIVRMWGAPPSIARKEMKPYIRQMPEFYEGLQYVLFWGKPSKTSGLVSPVALWQGVGFIIKGKDGALKVSNKFNNKNLLNGVVGQLKSIGKSMSKSEMQLQDVKEGAVDYDAFNSILRKLNE